MRSRRYRPSAMVGLNESPSEKEGKCNDRQTQAVVIGDASMKVPPKRKGNRYLPRVQARIMAGLNESPSEKEGKCGHQHGCLLPPVASMKVPPKRKGNESSVTGKKLITLASMKVPPKRKGNCAAGGTGPRRWWASMKVPPKRKGNELPPPFCSVPSLPQ